MKYMKKQFVKSLVGKTDDQITPIGKVTLFLQSISYLKLLSKSILIGTN